MATRHSTGSVPAFSSLTARPTDIEFYRFSATKAELGWPCFRRLHHDAIIALVTAFPNRAPEGLVHLAADIADAATAERQRRPEGAL